jgi:hypothetical protein
MTNPLNSVNLKKSKNLPKFQTMCSWYIKLQVHFKPLGVAVFSLLPISMHQYIRRDDAFEETSRDQGIYFIRFCLGGMNYIRGPATQSPPLIIFAFPGTRFPQKKDGDQIEQQNPKCKQFLHFTTRQASENHGGTLCCNFSTPHLVVLFPMGQ